MLSKAAAFVGIIALGAISQPIQNVQFKDMNGKSYDLYNLLSSGKYVFVEMMFNT